MCQELCLPFWYMILFNPPMSGSGNCNSHGKDTVTETKLRLKVCHVFSVSQLGTYGCLIITLI